MAEAEPGRGGGAESAGSARGLSAAEAARAAVDALAGGAALAIVTVVGTPEAAADALGARVLLEERGPVRGELDDAELHARAVELGRRMLETTGAAAGTETVRLAEDEWVLYAEVQRAPDELVIVGAGHIAVPLAELGVMLGFRTIVLDDREEFATAARFPADAEVVRADFSDPFRGLAIGARSYLVLVTRAHKYDYDCLHDLVARDVVPRYIGMIGSRRRVRAAFHALLEAGIPRERLRRVHAPVGLDIGAETPEEIAVSIAAEIVRVRRAGADADRAGDTAAEPERARAAEPEADATAEADALAAGRTGRRAATLGEKERVLERLLPETEGDDG